MHIAIKYSIFALIATVVNILGQDISLRLYEGKGTILVSVFAGTLVGLVTKYYLDKKYIFNFVTKNVAHDGHTFILYTLMGVATTAIFWGFEFAFEWVFSTKGWRYFGGVLGLAIGYYIKYRLDKHYVFVERGATE